MRNYFTNSKQVSKYSKDTKLALTELGLDWKVTKLQNYCYTITDKIKSKSFSIVRTDTKQAIGTVGSRYQPIQNDAALSSFVDALIGSSNGEIVNGGEFDGGGRVYLNVKLNKSATIGGGDVIDYYLQIFNSHDGSSSLSIRLMALREICSNGMVGLVKAGEFRIRHSQNAHLNISTARQKLGIIYSQLDEFKVMASRMVAARINNEGATQYFGRVFGFDMENLSDRNRDKLQSLSWHFQYGRGANLTTSMATVWGAYQAVIEYLDYGQGSKDVSKSNTFGKGYQTKVKALELAKYIAA